MTDYRRTKRALTFAICPSAFLIILSVGLTPEGARTIFNAHPPVPLKDEEGRVIDVRAPDTRPYSPRMTCGGCHPYEDITRAYHFTMGADQLSDDWGSRHRNRPWMSSPGQNGGQQQMSYIWLSKKKNQNEARVGVTTFRFAQTCAVCHPGGSLFERDRDGKRYDLRQRAHPKLVSSLDGDYHNAAWDRSGVLEADCLMCHSSGYDMKARADQLAKANYRWAATVGSRLGTVEGSALAGDTPKLTYQSSASDDGSLTVVPIRSRDENCLLCHAEAEVKKRGHVWDGRNADVHARLSCTACHVTQADHQIAKGRSNAVFLHDEMDDSNLSCAGCHNARKMGARRPAHRSVPASHLKNLTCVVCHVRDHNVTAVHTVDTTTGKTVGIPTNPEAHKYGETKSWQPAYFRLRNGQISSGNALLPSWWGNRVENVIHPLTLAETAKAFELAKTKLQDDNGDGKPEANTPAEITAMLQAVKQSLQSGRFMTVQPVYVKGHAIWEMQGETLLSRPHPQAVPLRWTFSHNVAPASRAFGSQGCSDCHGRSEGVLGTKVTVDPFGEDGKPVKVPAWKYLKLRSPDPYIAAK